jgi:hypothetical protein
MEMLADPDYQADVSTMEKLSLVNGSVGSSAIGVSIGMRSAVRCMMCGLIRSRRSGKVGIRPVVIVRRDVINDRSSVVLAVPCTDLSTG